MTAVDGVGTARANQAGRNVLNPALCTCTTDTNETDRCTGGEVAIDGRADGGIADRSRAACRVR